MRQLTCPIIVVLLATADLAARRSECPRRRRRAPALQSSVTVAPAMTTLVPEVPSTPPIASVPEPQRHCPRDMVLVQNRYCVDRYESSLVDTGAGSRCRPTIRCLPTTRSFWQRGSARLRIWRLLMLVAPRARRCPSSLLASVRQDDAKSRESRRRRAERTLDDGRGQSRLRGAGKRLCTLEQWQRACRGESDQKFPYGAEYRAKQCNVFREDHPGKILYGNFSVGMQDPRMGTVESAQGPLLRKTGQTTPVCQSLGRGRHLRHGRQPR